MKRFHGGAIIQSVGPNTPKLVAGRAALEEGKYARVRFKRDNGPAVAQLAESGSKLSLVRPNVKNRSDPSRLE